MATRMLIDARHPEETRVAVLQGNRIEEFDFESAEHKQIKGNIYLAKVTRVEPSLQAAFVDFGGNRHGFLAFSEIHPDYYQIPKEDREALLAEEEEAAEEEARLRAEDEDEGNMPGDEYDAEDEESGEALAEGLAEDGEDWVEEIDTSDKDSVATIEEGHLAGDEDSDDDSDEDDDSGNDNRNGRGGRSRGRRNQGRGRQQGGGSGRSRAKQVDEVRARRQALRRRYKIQDVIQRRQVLLVQVVKEERGNKGAALTTYLSLAGRYTVLMPNSSHGGGISRKINSAGDRKRLKQVVSDLSLPRSMGLIVRTAGLQRTKTEIKRDFDYLARLWDEIREKTLSSSAPSLIHSDSDLIKRAIRDIYNREIEEVVVEGEDGYRSAKAFMKLLMPSHARRVKAYSDPVPLFQRYGAEDQLRAMYDPMVQLKSGGYLIINPTEALVSIDINSGRSTKEHGIEQTALHTNLEAAREIARQLRLRDMAGLVVIDFIDMEQNSNTRKVEKAMKDALKNDRARIQVGRISGFGLMEMSRQRLRTGVLEATTRDCPHCDGTGLVRTASSAGLSALRLIEDEAARGKGTTIVLKASTEAAVYLLNAKRTDLQEIEHRYGVNVEVRPEGEDEGAKMSVSSAGPRPAEAPKFEPIVDDEPEEDFDEEDEDESADEDTESERDSDRSGGRNRNSENDDDDDGSKRRKRRRRRGGRGRNRKRSDDESSGGEDSSGDANDSEDSGSENDNSGESNSQDDHDTQGDADGQDRPKRRRRSRGGRGRKPGSGNAESANDSANDDERETVPDGAAAEVESEVGEQLQDDIAVVAGPDGMPETAEAVADETVKKPRRSRRKNSDGEGEEAATAESTSGGTGEEAAQTKPKPRRSRKKAEPEQGAENAGQADGAQPAEGEATPAPKPRRSRKKADATAQDPAGEVSSNQPANQQAAQNVSDHSQTDFAAVSGPEGTAQTAEAEAGDSEAGSDGPDSSGSTRRGWWQRTFGN